MEQDLPQKENMLKCLWVSMMGTLDAQLVKFKFKSQREHITCHEFAQLMQDVIDHEISKEALALFEKQQQKCKGCSKKFGIEQETITLIKRKLEREKVPSPVELAADIRARVLLF